MTTTSHFDRSMALTQTATKILGVLERESELDAGEILVCFGTAMLIYANSRGLSRDQVRLWLSELPAGVPGLFDEGGTQ